MQQTPLSCCQDKGVKLLRNGGAAGIRTLAGLTTSNDLANRPLEPLEYCSMIVKWRRGWDSNPRTPFEIAGFQDQFLEPLGHPSEPDNTFIIISVKFVLVNKLFIIYLRVLRFSNYYNQIL